MIKYNQIEPKLKAFWPLIVGFIILTAPTYQNLISNVWNQNDQAHGPIVLLLVIYLFYDKRAAFELSAKPAIFSGWIVLILGILLYIIGRSQDILFIDMAAQVVILMSIILIFSGWKVLFGLWFPLFFMFFMIPLPGIIVDAVTMPMKIAVSQVAEHVLYWFDYPIARNGVILQIGQYQLLVADACAGMHTLISLEALGLLYLSLVKHDSLARNLLLAVLIIPISFTANTIRVISITLVTYYFGDEVGQGFVHGFAGLLLFMIALILIMSVDKALQAFMTRYSH